MKKINKDNKKSKSIKRPANAVMVIMVLYILIVVMSVYGRVNILKEISTTDITFMTIIKEFWFSILIIILLLVTIIAYNKKDKYGIVLELSIGLSMLLNVIISVIITGFDIFALLATLIIPAIIIGHAVWVYINTIKKKQNS